VFNVLLAANTAPKVLPLSTISIKSEKGTYTESLLPYAVDDYTLASNLVWSINNLANHAIVTIVGTDLIVMSPANGWSGVDSIVIKVSDAGGLSSTIKVVINVSSAPNKAPILSVIPTQVQTDSSAFSPIDLLSYISDDYTNPLKIKWSFGSSSNFTISQVNGIAKITLTNTNWVGSEAIPIYAMDEDGLVTTELVTIDQEAAIGSNWFTKPSISFNMANSIVGVGNPVGYTATILGAESWQWYFEGGSPSTGNSLNQNTVYKQAGTYSVTLFATNSFGKDSVVKKDIITVFGIKNADTTVCKGSSVSLSVNLTNFDSYTWSNAAKTTTIVATITSDTLFAVTGKKGLFTFNDTIRIKVNKAVHLGSDTTICAGSNLSLKPGIFKSYLWQDGSTASSLTVNNKTPQTYSVTVTDGIGCRSSDNLVVTAIKPLPVSGLVKLLAICQGSDTTLTATNGVSYLWSNTYKTINSIKNAIVVNSADKYFVSVTAANGCTAVDTATIVVNALPSVSIQASASILCLGDSVVLTGKGAQSYSWSTGITEGKYNKLSVIGNNVFSVTGTDLNGCSNGGNTTIVVNSKPELAIVNKQITVCSGQNVSLTATGAATITWNNDVTNGSAFTPLHSASYIATGTNSFGCTDTIHVAIVVNALPTVFAKTSASTICRNSMVTLQGEGAVSYLWSNNKKDKVSFKADSTMRFTVSGTDEKGCESINAVTVTVLQPYHEQIALVTLSELNDKHTIIAWQRTQGKRTQKYDVYRELDSTKTFSLLIGSRTFNQPSYIIDSTADMSQQAYRYRLVTSDSVCNNVDSSIIHETIHLRSSKSLNNGNDLSWNAYQGIPIISYKIYKIDQQGLTKQIGFLSSDNDLSFTDNTEPLIGVHYRIGFALQDSIYIDKLKSDSGPFSQSLSNLAESQLVGEPVIAFDNAIVVYPNPAKDIISIDSKSGVVKYEIYNSKGQLVQTENTNATQISIEQLTGGIYEIIIHTNKGMGKGRFFKER
jgi:hypothetical protein